MPTFESSRAGQRALRSGKEIRNWHRVPNDVDKGKLEQAGRLILEALGEDPNRDGLKDTPRRFANYYSQIMNGNFLKPEDYVTDFENDGGYVGPVVLKNAELYSLCEHHLASFVGEISIAYQPKEKIIGLSKLVRIARVYAKRPQVQERLTKQIAQALDKLLCPEWVVVRYEAEHHCMRIRGIRIKDSRTVTIAGHGDWPSDVFRI